MDKNTFHMGTQPDGIRMSGQMIRTKLFVAQLQCAKPTAVHGPVTRSARANEWMNIAIDGS